MTHSWTSTNGQEIVRQISEFRMHRPALIVPMYRSYNQHDTTAHFDYWNGRKNLRAANKNPNNNDNETAATATVIALAITTTAR